MLNFVKTKGIVCALVLVSLAACRKKIEHESLLDRLEIITKMDSTVYAHLHASVDGARLVQVLGMSSVLSVISRTDQLTQLMKFPCINCHSKPLREMKSTDPAGRKAHWDIHLQHAPETILSCVVCHDESNLNTLRSITGNEITLDHSYQLCQQCHFKQFSDWKGGAHGKRVGGWAPPRVVKLCIECHNPHQPLWDKRWPVQPSLTMKRLISNK